MQKVEQWPIHEATTYRKQQLATREFHSTADDKKSVNTKEARDIFTLRKSSY
jgi:hypothetical protein